MLCEKGVRDGMVSHAPLLVETTVSTKTCPPECITMVQLGASKRIRFYSEMRRGWDSNPRNTLISVHRISNAAHSTNSDTSPVIEYKESF